MNNNIPKKNKDVSIDGSPNSQSNNLDDYTRFIQISNEIKRIGWMVEWPRPGEKRLELSLINHYEFDLNPNEYILLEDDCFYQTITVVFQKIQESYELKINKISKEIILSRKRTSEGCYGNIYNIEALEVLDFMEFIISSVDYVEAFKKKVIESFDSAFNILMPWFSHLNFWCQDTSKDKVEKLINEKVNFIKNNYCKFRLPIFDKGIIDYNGQSVEYNYLIKIIMESQIFLQKNMISQNILSFEMELTQDKYTMYLMFNQLT